MDVDAAVAGDLWLACGHPFPIDVLPAVTVRGDEVQQEGVHGVGVQPRDTNLEDGEHPSKRKGRNGVPGGMLGCRAPGASSAISGGDLPWRASGVQRMPRAAAPIPTEPLFANALYIGVFTLNHHAPF